MKQLEKLLNDLKKLGTSNDDITKLTRLGVYGQMMTELYKLINRKGSI
jgi:hypothetical protein